MSGVSTNYGLPSNLLQVQVQSASVSGRKITLYDGYSGYSYTQDNLGAPFELAYTGTATGTQVSYTVTVVSGAATTFAATSPNTGESFSVGIGSGGYSTVSQLVQYINGTSYFVANTLSNGSLPCYSLDAASAVVLPAVSASGVPTYEAVSAALADPVWWFNNIAGALSTWGIVSGVTSSAAKLPSVIPFTAFSGATSVAPTLSDYASGFNVALTVPGWVVFCDSNVSGVIALGATHVATASNTLNGRPRRFFSGSSVGDTIAIALLRAQQCNAITSTYAYPGIYRNNAAGINTLYGGLYAAAAAAGIACGNAVALPLTSKVLTGNGVEVNLTTAQIDQLQQGGVMPIATSLLTNQPSIVSDFTTWLSDANPENVFNQQVACRFWLAYSMNNAMLPYVGSIADPLSESKILNAAKACLNSLLYNSGNANGVLVNWDTSTLQLVYTGINQLAAVSVSVVFVGQNRFITEYITVLPLNLVINASTQ